MLLLLAQVHDKMAEVRRLARGLRRPRESVSLRHSRPTDQAPRSCTRRNAVCFHVQTDLSNSSIFLNIHAATRSPVATCDQEEKKGRRARLEEHEWSFHLSPSRTFSIPLNYVDVMRQTRTRIDNASEHALNECWNFETCCGSGTLRPRWPPLSGGGRLRKECSPQGTSQAQRQMHNTFLNKNIQAIQTTCSAHLLLPRHGSAHCLSHVQQHTHYEKMTASVSSPCHQA